MSSDFIHRLSGRQLSDGASSSMLDSGGSDFFDALDSSRQFVVGDYKHNLEVLDNLTNNPTENEVTEDRLIYTATHRLARPEDNYARRRVTVSRSELVSGSELGADDDLEQGSSGRRTSAETRGGEMIIEFFRIFKGDDSYMEVSRDEIRRVRVMHKRFREGSQFSFNYNTLLIIASILAGLGLGSNSTATIIASMLVSPLMGPVMGMAYGATIMDWRLFFLGLFTELVSLISCIAVGAILAGCMFPVLDPYSKGPFVRQWPTDEMEGRAEMFSFYLGIPIAFFSGLGVAVSVLDEQTSSLVGVAISASLLPPAVNAGMLWVTYFFVDSENYKEKDKLWLEGIISLALTLVNIVMIILSSMLMFRAKEVSSFFFLVDAIRFVGARRRKTMIEQTN